MLYNSRFSLLVFFFAFFSAFVCAQNNKQIEIISADILSFDKQTNANAQKLIGHVGFKHGNAVMYCDSAYFYSDQNMVDAFGNVNIHQGDTLHLYGDYLNYDGNVRLAMIRDNVRLVNKETTLTTDYLDYDIAKGIGFYTNYGNIVNANNKLTSERGYYYTHEKAFYFRNDVEVVNPKYVIKSDTMKYNTVSRTTYFFGPSTITSKNNLIYCENGWYNTKTNISQFSKNAYLKSETRLLKGDSLQYDRNKGVGRAYKNIHLIDSARNIHLLGNYAYYREKPEYAMITDKTVLMHIAKQDTLFLHADTIFSREDTSSKQKFIKAYHHVQFFRPDLQGRCDSMTYSTADSTMRLYETPIIWHGESQITSDYVELHMANQTIKDIQFVNNSFVVSKEDTGKFNQIKGRKMTGFFKDGKLDKILVSGNGQSVYFAKDKNIIIGANKSVCSNINIYMNDGKIGRIVFLEQPDATFFPLHKLNREEINLKGYSWLEKLRPLQMKDIFDWK